MARSKISIECIVELYNLGLSCQKIADIFHRDESAISIRLRKIGLKKRSNSVYRRRKFFNNSYFNSIDSEHKAYWLGFLMADGCLYQRNNRNHVQKTVQLYVMDKEVPYKFIQSIEGNFKPSFNKGVWGVTLDSPEMFNSLNSLGCTPKKSLTLKFPVINISIVNHFIRGYFDGDGCVYTYTPKNYSNTSTIYRSIGVSICGTLEFLTVLHGYINLGNIHKEKRRTTNTWTCMFSGTKKCRKMYEFLYKDATVYLERKKYKFENYFKERCSTTTISNPDGLPPGLRYSLISYESMS